MLDDRGKIKKLFLFGHII